MNQKTPEEFVYPDANSEDERFVLHYLADHHRSVRKHIEEQSGFSQAKTIRVLNGLISKGFVVKEGQGKNTAYSVRENR